MRLLKTKKSKKELNREWKEKKWEMRQERRFSRNGMGMSNAMGMGMNLLPSLLFGGFGFNNGFTNPNGFYPGGNPIPIAPRLRIYKTRTMF